MAVSDGFSEHDVGGLGFARAGSLEEALERALGRQGAEASIVVLPHGGETVPVLRR